MDGWMGGTVQVWQVCRDR